MVRGKVARRRVERVVVRRVAAVRVERRQVGVRGRHRRDIGYSSSQAGWCDLRRAISREQVAFELGRV